VLTGSVHLEVEETWRHDARVPNIRGAGRGVRPGGGNLLPFDLEPTVLEHAGSSDPPGDEHAQFSVAFEVNG
jgi:hypothetical protein